jgi:hypothetical protein
MDIRCNDHRARRDMTRQNRSHLVTYPCMRLVPTRISATTAIRRIGVPLTNVSPAPNECDHAGHE